MSYPYTISARSLTIFIDGDQHSIADTHANFVAIKDAIRSQAWDKIPDLIDQGRVVREFVSSTGKLELVDGTIVYEGEVMTGAVIDHILRLKTEGFDVGPFLAFVERLQKNPSFRVRNDLFDWLQRGNMPITSDGFILAFKRVRDNYTDVHSGTFDNTPGKVVEIARHKVDDNFDNTCSHGLHFCSRNYLPHFGGDRIVVLKIDPADIVAFPRDYNLSKGRCCKYEVVSEVTEKAEDTLTSAVDDSYNVQDTITAECWNCDADVDADDQFCSTCGADLSN